MSELRAIVEERASLCPSVGKPLAYGLVAVVPVPGEGIKLAFFSDDKGPDGEPRLSTLLLWETPAKAKMGGRLNCHSGYYLIFEGGKNAAKRVADALNAG
jgi:hypothetical protein